MKEKKNQRKSGEKSTRVMGYKKKVFMILKKGLDEKKERKREKEESQGNVF